jgi:uncharacterized membrane protein (UPF0127 family)
MKIGKSINRLLLLSVVVLSPSALVCNTPHFERGYVYVHNQPLKVEIARQPWARNRGLMFRKQLKDIDGMLFIFEREDYHGFWMKNTYLPLEILFIDDRFQIADLDTMAPLDTTPHLPLAPVKYALELPLGSLERYKIKIGDKISYKLRD